MEKNASSTGAEYGSASNPTADIAQQSQPATVPFRSISALLDDGPAYVTNFNGDQKATWAFLAKVQGGDSHKIGDNFDKPIDIRHWFAHRIEMVNSKTGEMTTVTRIALVDGNGEVFTAVSDGVMYGLDQIRQVFGDGPYNGEIICKVKQVSTRSGNRTYNLVPA